MPAKYIIKKYLSGGFYHLYNRGVEKRNIFVDEQDYKVFISYLKLYLLPKKIIYEEIKKKNLPLQEFSEKIIKISNLNNFFDKIRLLCFCLMPNHFHFLLQQKDTHDMDLFIQSILTKYVRYFNPKYERVGPLFQGRYKAVLVEKEDYFLHLSHYIHLNPQEILSEGQQLVSYPWSSYSAYVKGWKLDWLKKDLILSYFERVKGYGYSSYQGFVEGYKEDLLLEKNLYIDL
jgi:putative transposase